MNIIDLAIIIIIIMYAVKGFKFGALKELVNFLGVFVVIVLAFSFRTPLSVFLYENAPFFDFGGILSGVGVLNIIVYELLAFILLATVLMLILKIIINVTNLIEFILKLTIILAIPSKIIGAIIGAIEGLVVCFVLLLACKQSNSLRLYLEESNYADKILTETPVLSKCVEPIYNAGEEIYKLAKSYENETDKNVLNLEALDVLLKYDVIKPENASKLVNTGKLKIDGATEVINKYKEAKND